MSRKKNTVKQKTKFNYLFLPVILLLAIVPLIVRVYFVEADIATYSLFGKTPLNDIFSQGKAFVLFLFGLLLLLVAAGFFQKLFEKRDKLTTFYLIAAGVFLLFTLLSALFSDYKTVAFLGLYSRAEGFISICCYILIFVYTMYAFKSENDFRYIVLALFIVIGINTIIGTFQYFGFDFYASPFGLKLITPLDYQTRIQGTNVMYQYGKLHGSFFHYNYVGSYTAIVIPLLLVLTFYAKKTVSKIILAVFSLLSVWLLFGSTSRAGIIGIAAAFLFAIVIFGNTLLKHWRASLVVIASVVVAIAGLGFATEWALFARIPSLAGDLFSVFSDTSAENYLDKLPVRDIQSKDGNIIITAQQDAMTLSFDGVSLSFMDSNGAPIPFQRENESQYRLLSEKYPNFVFRLEAGKTGRISNIKLFIRGAEDPDFLFNVNAKNELHLAYYPTGFDIDLDAPPSIGFKGKEKLGSMRGYIWSRALPLLPKHILLGSGPDTFIFEFPQYDLLGKYYAYDTPNMVVDKPHNLYLQTWMNQGAIALLAFLVLTGVYIIDSLRLYFWKRKYTQKQAMGIACLLGVIGYLAAGMFNDSVVDVAPLFWVILAAGIAINYQVRKEPKEKKQKLSPSPSL